MFINFRQPYLEADTGTTGGGTTETTSTETQSTETTQQNTTTETQQTTEQPKIKVKYNHEEMELPYDEAITHIQKGMNYDKGVERAKQEARDAYIAEQGYSWNDKPITNEAEYKQALAEKAEYDRRQQLIDNGIDPEIVKKFISDDPTVKRANELIAQQDQQKYFDSQVKELEAYSPGIDVTKLDPSVVAEWSKGKSLVDAYIKFENSQLKTKLQAFEKGSITLDVNNKNASSTPGSTTGLGTGNLGHITKEQVEANRGNKAWMQANLTTIEESMKKW